MKQLTALLTLLTVALPSHAASPRTCRITSTARANHHRVAAAAHRSNLHAAQPQFVVTAFAVPVAVPVAPFAPYWYGVSDYQAAHPSLRGSASQRIAPEALPRTLNGDAANREAEPRSSAFPGGAWEREDDGRERKDDGWQRGASLVALKCASCHGRTSPSQGLSLVELPSLSAADRLRAIRVVVNGDMPPDDAEPLTDADRAAILRELTND